MDQVTWRNGGIAPFFLVLEKQVLGIQAACAKPKPGMTIVKTTLSQSDWIKRALACFTQLGIIHLHACGSI